MLAAMSVSNSLAASQPHINATVSASAGSGKTWLLITRIVRLLLAGATPGSILALTFTRKAAAEMQIRLNERLYELASCEDDELVKKLEEMQTEVSPENLQRARSLYEQSLHSLNPVRLQTFHSFCQDILARFPLEANVPPGFELLDDTSLLEQQAWEELFTEATQNPEGQLTGSLDFLMQENNSVANLRSSLSSMLGHRSDWWAYTFEQRDPVKYAHTALQQQLQLSGDKDPLSDFFNDFTKKALADFAKLLALHATKTNASHCEMLVTLLSQATFDLDTLKQVEGIFLTDKGEPRARKASKAQESKMGTEGQDQFLDIHARLSERLIETLDYLKRQRTLKINQAWYFSGQRFIEIFQRIKRELRMLDFTDLEWHCYQLLNTSDNALWVQYKVDQRIDHFLIDEFQDTNPTQWQLLAPLFEEMAAGSSDRWRTAFLVGDEKQSIYGFRRANPALQAQASGWLKQHLNAQAAPLDFSWRSSPAIIQFVNHVFQQPEAQAVMPNFSKHDTNLKTLPGYVSLLPLCEPTDDETEKDTCIMMRNPLLEPRKEKINTLYQDEANMIAEQIQKLTDTPHYINDGGRVRKINHGDIMILVKARKPIKEYEQALREKDIPFISDKRGTLMDNLEIQDLEKLLDSLITPFNNLAIAHVLKSPIFDASDEDLITLAKIKDVPHWYDRLQQLPETFGASHPLSRAAKLLPRWHALADTIPVHDLLDRIFAETNLLHRYAASVDASLKLRVQANLQRFLELSLELDAGRYPSLTHFLHYLRSLRKPEASSPNEPNVNETGKRVTILTIHASKGLESPVVFLADCNRGSNNTDAYSTLVDWPANSQQPERFQLLLSKQNTDALTQKVQEKTAKAQAREQLNLLYVALTRAREYLFISGVATTKKSSGWYQLARRAMTEITEEQDDGSLQYIFSEHEIREDTIEKKPATTQLKIIPELLQPIKKLAKPEYMIAPSKANREQSQTFITDDDLDAEHAQTRGIAIHRALDLLSGKRTLTDKAIHQILMSELHQDADSSEIDQWLAQAQLVVNDAQFAMIFSPDKSVQCFNELPLLYDNNGQSVYGLIDRLIINNDEILLIDYKSHAQANADTCAAMARDFTKQMKLYEQGIQKIWPNHAIKKGVLFTACQKLVWLGD